MTDSTSRKAILWVKSLMAEENRRTRPPITLPPVAELPIYDLDPQEHPHELLRPNER